MYNVSWVIYQFCSRVRFIKWRLSAVEEWLICIQPFTKWLQQLWSLKNGSVPHKKDENTICVCIIFAFHPEPHNAIVSTLRLRSLFKEIRKMVSQFVEKQQRCLLWVNLWGNRGVLAGRILKSFHIFFSNGDFMWLSNTKAHCTLQWRRHWQGELCKPQRKFYFSSFVLHL